MVADELAESCGSGVVVGEADAEVLEGVECDFAEFLFLGDVAGEVEPVGWWSWSCGLVGFDFGGWAGLVLELVELVVEVAELSCLAAELVHVNAHAGAVSFRVCG